MLFKSSKITYFREAVLKVPVDTAAPCCISLKKGHATAATSRVYAISDLIQHKPVGNLMTQILLKYTI